MAAISQIAADGLSPEDYHLTALQAYREGTNRSGVEQARRDPEFGLVLTDSLIRLCCNLIFGKVDPTTQQASWNFSRSVDDLEPVAFLQRAVDAKDIARFIQDLISQYAIYSGLKGAPADYRRMAAKGAWGQIPNTLRQEPGPSNALGQAKFIFPNSHFIFLHDTPSKDLFSRTDRAFSSGCIRVERPFKRAELFLRNVAGWDRTKIDALIAGGRTETVFLSKPLPVLLVYLTAEHYDGQALFKNDIYERDAPLLEALDQPFRFHEAP